MRILATAIVCLLTLMGPAAAEDEKKEEPKKPATEMTEPERAAALKKAQNLTKTLLALCEQAKYREAVPRAREALALLERAFGSGHPLVAAGLYNLSSALTALGAHGEALSLMERALEIRENAFGSEHGRVAQCLHELGLLLYTLGRYEEARPLYERALKIQKNVLGRAHPDVAKTLSNLALLSQKQGAYEEARTLYEHALRITENAVGGENPLVAKMLNNLATLLKALGQYEQARQLYERALRISEKGSGREYPEVALSLSNLASLLHSLGQYEQAMPLQERALKITERALGPDHSDVATSLNNRAALLMAQGQYAEARPLYERALKIWEKALGADHPSVATSLNNLALLLDSLGAYEEARPLYERALKIREKALGPDHPIVAASLNNVALMHYARRQYERAGPLLARCLDIVERHMRHSVAGLQASERLPLGRSLRFYLTNSLRVAPHLGRSGHAEVLRFKGLLARVAAAECKLTRADSADATARVATLRAAERRFSKIANSPPSSFRNKPKMARWQQAYAKAAAEREMLAVALAKDFAPLRQGLERLDLRVPDIQGALTKDAVLIDYLRTGDQYIAWLVPRSGDVKRVDLGKTEVIEAAAAAFAERAADSGEADWPKAGKTLRDLIFKPLAQYLPKGTTAIHICPDAALAAVPFGALPSADGRTLLGTKYTISSISMAQDLVPWTNAPKSGRGALLLGGVDYGKATESTAEARPRVIASRAPRGGKYPDLAGTKAEVAGIRLGFGTGATAVLGADATESLVRSASEGKRVIHLATHGFVHNNLMRGLTRRNENKRWLGASMERQLAGGHDPMNLSGLAMAGANTRKGGGDDDGILTALEASHLDLDGVELVVLSACSTALGTAESGEGVVGLVRGFQMAGAKQVIGSLWDVSDDATKALMVKFYELRSPKSGKGIGAAEALKKAQAFIRDHSAHPEWKHPYYWAAWVVWGVD